jgi:hypothetical protein
MRVLATLCLVMALLPGGCASWPPTAADSDLVMREMRATAYDYSAYFHAFDNPWVGRSRDELLQALGPPDAIFEARHQFADFEAGIPASSYVYTGNDASLGHCIDTYVVDEWTSTVIKYYCR